MLSFLIPRLAAILLVVSFSNIALAESHDSGAPAAFLGLEDGGDAIDLSLLLSDETLSPEMRALMWQYYSERLEEDGRLGAIAGLSGDCKIKFHKIVIPYEADCTLKGSVQATKNMATLGVSVLVAGFCLVIDAATEEITAPLCFAVLYKPMNDIIRPELVKCSDAGRASEIKVKLRMDKPSKSSFSARCR